ncbi:MAG: hypothetical protein COA99_16180 [Moraxellaceae bacterium]|nr:MAG: hypothetical protein COA99_16180 [Moraxellaceae bacterium]
MINSKIIVLAIIPVLLASGCGGDVQRSTTDSNDLTGLWRMSLKSSQGSLKANSYSSYTLVETANGLVMKDCTSRDSANVGIQNEEIVGLPISPLSIDDNDTLSADNAMGVTYASKMALAAKFDMGDLHLSSPELGSLNFTDLCVISSDASMLGAIASDNISATTIYNGELLLIDITAMGKLKKGSYTVSREPALGDVSIRLQSESFRAPYNRTEMTLASGTMTVSEDSLVWTKGSFSGTLSNGKSISGDFSFENP